MADLISSLGAAEDRVLYSLDCAKSLFRGLRVCWLECIERPDDMEPLQKFQAETAKRFGRLASAYVAVDSALAEEVLREIRKGNARAGTRVEVKVDRVPFTTFHEASRAAVEQVLLSPVANAPVTYVGFHDILARRSVATSCWEGLAAGLAAFPVEGARAYWGRIYSELTSRGLAFLDDLTTRVQIERANAEAWLESAVAGNGNEEKADPLKPPTLTRKERSRLWKAQAMMLLQENPNLKDCDIADRVGVTPGTLSKCKEYQTLKTMTQGAKTDRHGGYRTIDPTTGQQDVEAYSHEADPAEFD